MKLQDNQQAFFIYFSKKISMFELNVKLHSSQPVMIMKDDLAGEDGIILGETVCLVLRHVLRVVCVRA